MNFSNSNSNINNKTVDDQLDQIGLTALWVGVVSHSFSSFAYVIASKRCKESNQIYYYINIIICSIATTCYFLMAMRQSDYIKHDGHLAFWARYLEFLIGTPLLLIDLCMMIRLPSSTMFYICFMDILMIGSGWFATISTSVMSKWIFFILGCIFFYPILDAVLGFTPDLNITNPNSITSHNRFVILYTAIVWNGYVILWILHDGFEWVSINTECVIHTILDILAKDLFGVILLYNHTDKENNDNKETKNDENNNENNNEKNNENNETEKILHLSHIKSSIRRAHTMPLQRNIRDDDPQIVITPPLPITPGQRRPSVSSDQPLVQEDSCYDDYENDDYEIRPVYRSRSPSPLPMNMNDRPSRSRSREQSPLPPLPQSRNLSIQNDTHNIHNNNNNQTFERIRRMI